MQINFTPASNAHPRYRSGVVARMVGIPVSTLRIWERRYQVVGPTLTASGHRLYSGADVERLMLIKQLVDLGHAIGSLARLPSAELLNIADARAALAAQPAPTLRPRAVLLGLGLPRRLGALSLRRVATWADLPSAEAGLPASGKAPTNASGASPSPADGPSGTAGAPAHPALQAELLVAELATLQPESADRLLALAAQWGVQRGLVVYGFGSEASAQRLRQAGWRLHRAPLADADLRAQVAELVATLFAPAHATSPDLRQPEADLPVPPRRFDDAALYQLAEASTTVACECPRHVAELVMQLALFETYSDECLQRNPADADLHRHLLQVAGTARAMFEGALLRVAEAGSLPLPPPPAAPTAPVKRPAATVPG
ncbi:MAG: MerR family transcriptional regulator [Microbacteriaceae bacterium]|nr:MerR family transcriptional regulator [Burkholderiaceae bacterium]